MSGFSGAYLALNDLMISFKCRQRLDGLVDDYAFLAARHIPVVSPVRAALHRKD